MAKKTEECPAGIPLWVVTYSDMVTLLLTFFVLMLSMANMDKVKFLAVSQSLQKAFGFHATAQETKFSLPVLPSPPKTKFSPLLQQDTTNLYKRIESELKMNKTLQHIDITKKDKDTIVLRIKDIVLFDQGEATLNPESYPLLRKISDIVRPLPVTMRIEGHTDSTLLENVTMKNWDLSVARAVSVLSFYNQGKLLSLDRISAVGYGDEHPITTSTAEKDRKQNRRVDFVLNLKRASEMSSEQTGTVPF